MFDKENSFEVCVRDDPDDTTLGDVLLSILPAYIREQDVEIVEFARAVSSYQISSALKRGETNINILDVYESPTHKYIASRGLNCPIRFFLGDDIDFLAPENQETLERFVHYCNIAYEYLFHRSLCGKYVSSVHNIIDIYQKINPKSANGWGNKRKIYIDCIAPAAFWIFKDDYLSARMFCRTATIDNLIDLLSEDGFTVDDCEDMILPAPIRRRVINWLVSVPGVLQDDNTLANSQASTDYQAMMIAGLKTLSSLAII